MAHEEKLNGLDLFAGIGGISLALKPWVRTVCYVEIERFCQAVLQSRIAAGELEDAPIWDDVTTFDPGLWIGAVDIVTGGFPCQDISTAGKGAGLEGERSVLFYEIMRCAGVVRPQFIFLENVPAINTRGGREVAGALAALRFDGRWGHLSAYDVGAPHQRNRWWCLASDPGRFTEGQPQRELRRKPPSIPSFNGGKKPLAHPSKFAKREQADQANTIPTGGEAREKPCGGSWWAVEPNVGRVANGVPLRVDRLKGLGNSVVPATAREAFRRLMGVN